MNLNEPDSPTLEDPNSTADAIIEDLNTEDVLPAEESDVIPDTEEPEETASSQVESWSGLGADLGHRANKTPLEDEFAATQDLVNAGVEEADNELRDLEDKDADQDDSNG
ncbi:hypothetical protein [Verrucomicrobium spinosum]|uniref:hypothetical protein n=1 Tax=Verrucomicrobium spinosum TaxID=2736 RepID=UPI0001745E0F|nr:hypothetical protein [Verrucomicrobium spinosum]